MSERILLFIPCYNCAPQIERVIAQLSGPVSQYLAEVLILDNGSRDGTQDRAARAARNVPGLPITIGQNGENYHLGGSHKAAFAYASANAFTHVIVLHGDDQADLNDILPILERGDHRRHDTCLGARFMPGARITGYSWFRRFGNAVFNALFSIVSARRIHDLGSGLNLFGSAVFSHSSIQRTSDDLRFNIYLLLGLIDRRCSMVYFPISWREEDQISNVRLASQALRTLGIARDYLLRKRRFRTADHRDRPVAVYRFDGIARSGDHG